MTRDSDNIARTHKVSFIIKDSWKFNRSKLYALSKKVNVSLSVNDGRVTIIGSKAATQVCTSILDQKPESVELNTSIPNPDFKATGTILAMTCNLTDIP